MITVELTWREVTVLHHLLSNLRIEQKQHPKRLDYIKRSLNAVELKQLVDKLILPVKAQKSWN